MEGRGFHCQFNCLTVSLQLWTKQTQKCCAAEDAALLMAATAASGSKKTECEN